MEEYTVNGVTLKTGDAVSVMNAEGGYFAGRVLDFSKDGNVVRIEPNAPALRLWYPNGYTVGSAHWGTTLTKRPGI